MNSETICQKCGFNHVLRDGYDDTGFCDDCAQAIAIAAEAFVIAHREDFDVMKMSNSMDIDVNFLGLCEAVLPVEAHYDPAKDPNRQTK